MVVVVSANFTSTYCFHTPKYFLWPTLHNLFKSDQVFPSNFVFVGVVLSRALFMYCCNLPFPNMEVNLNFELSREICLWLCGKSFSLTLTAHCVCYEILYDLMGRDKIKLVIGSLILCLDALAASSWLGLYCVAFTQLAFETKCVLF